MKKLLSVVLSLLMVFSALPFTMMASAATVTAAGYTFDWIRGSDGANDFDEVITPAGDALTTKDYNDKTCMTTSRNLVDGDKLVYTTKDSVAKGLYKVIFELRANTGRADLNIKVGDRDYGKFVSPGGGTDTKVVLFTDYVQAETAPVTIEFVAKSTGSMYIEQLHFEKIDYEYSLDGNNATLTKYIGAGGDIEIPEKIDGYTVVGVGADCFKGCETLTSVKAYKNVAKIDEGAFADCVNLEKITIDNGTCEIFDSAETISDTAIISGGNKSTAQAYAEKYGREFEMITFATIGDEPYSSLEEAFAAAQDGDRIVLVKDYDLTSSITTDKAVVLDLAGYTLKAPTATITTTADFEIASTAEGKGEVYSGAETVEPSTDADKIGTVADVSNKALYVKGHYPSTGAAKIASYENRVAIKKLIAVDYGKNYIFNTGSGTVVTRFIIREYKADGSFVKSYGGVADGDTYTPSSADVEAIGITIYIDGNSSYDIFGSIQSGAFTPSAKLAPVRAQIKFGSAFVKTSADFKMSNIKVTASATGSFYEQTDANAMPKFTAYDCVFAAASTSVVRPLKFSPNASQIDMQNSTVTMGNNNNNAGFSVASASVGTFKNVKFSMGTGVAVYIYNTGAEGITFDGCTVKQSGYDQVAAMRVANGNVTLTGGTNISGDNKASNVLYVEGGKLTMDGVTVTGDKGTDTSRIVFYIKNTPTIIIKK
ncbi:MAG: leucine-rich repeat protein, partial [Clostridia bacterium]|nr:leucine-rich repeat protein [Clostridia bacterium]